MKKTALALVGALLLMSGIVPGGAPASGGLPFGAIAARADDTTSNPCAPPTQISPTITQTAWQLWVAATCPVKIASGKFQGLMQTKGPRPASARRFDSPVGPASSLGAAKRRRACIA